MTYRETRAVTAIVEGKSQYEALRRAGWSHHMAAHPDIAITEEMRGEIELLKKRLQERAFAACLIDATEIHEYLSDALRADMRDIRNDDGSFKPQGEWPEIWGRMMEAGDCEIETASIRSHDGEDGPDEHGWEETGTVVTKVKLKFSSRVKLLELAMRHKGVNAMVEQKAGDVNITFVTAEKARQLGSAKRRLEKVIDVKT